MSSSLSSSSVILDTSPFTLSTTPSLITFPPAGQEGSLAHLGLSSTLPPIFSDDDIKLPDISGLSEFKVTESEIADPIDFLNYNFDFDFNGTTNAAEESSSSNNGFLNIGSFPSDDNGKTDTVKDTKPADALDFVSYDFDFDFNSTSAKDDSGKTDTVKDTKPADPLDLLSYDFDFDFNSTSAKDDSGKTDTVKDTKPADALDFLSYDFDFNFNSTDAEAPNDINATSYKNNLGTFPGFDLPDLSNASAGFESSDFKDYSFDLFGEDNAKDEAGGEEVDEVYDLNDGWIDDPDYVEMTSEEMKEERDKFDKKYTSLVKHPAPLELPDKLDLDEWYIAAPPIIGLGGLFLMFLPCIIIMFIDDSREIKGKPRYFGLPRISKNIRKEVYEKTPNGEWKRVESIRKDSSTGSGGHHSSYYIGNMVQNPQESITCDIKENVLYTEENECGQTASENRPSSSSSMASDSKSDASSSKKTSTTSNSSKASSKSRRTEVGSITDGSSPKMPQVHKKTSGDLSTGETKNVPGTSGDSNWALY